MKGYIEQCPDTVSAPIINQTARMQFTVRAGEGVHTLEMLAEGIEISGIQQPLDNTTSFDWVNGDVLPVKVGDQSASVRITQATQNADNSWWRIPAYCPQTHALTLSVCC